jgi:hypothetical protein
VIKNLFKLAVFLLIANALYQFGPVWIHHSQFKKALNEMAMEARNVPDSAMVDAVMDLAQENKVPIDRDAVQIERHREHVIIDAPYVEVVRVVPGYDYTWRVHVHVDVWQIKSIPGK